MSAGWEPFPARSIQFPARVVGVSLSALARRSLLAPILAAAACHWGGGRQGVLFLRPVHPERHAEHRNRYGVREETPRTDAIGHFPI